MVPMVMSPATPIPFSRYSGFDRHGISPIGAIAAAPMSYRVIAKLRHRKLSAIGALARAVPRLGNISRICPALSARWRFSAREGRGGSPRGASCSTGSSRLVEAAAADRRRRSFS
jgi:hypothetical protein